MITRFETHSPIDGTPLSGMIYTPDMPVAVMTLVHGFGEHCERYGPMMDHLGQRGIATVALDLRGHGRSGGKRGVCLQYEHLRSDVDALLQKTEDEFPNLPNILYGHSMGGGLVLDYTFSRGQAGLAGVIASAPLITLPAPTPKLLEFIVKLLRRIAPEMTIKNTISGDKVSTLPEEQKLYEADPLNHDRLGVGLAVDLVETGDNILSRSKNWTAPLLLMHAKNDQLTSFSGSENFAANAQNCTFIGYDDAEHEIHNDVTRAAVFNAITTFIQGRM